MKNKIIFVMIILILFFCNMYFTKDIEYVDYNNEQIEEIVTIKSEVNIIDTFILEDIKTTSTTKNLEILETSKPIVKIEPIKIVKTKTNTYVPEKVKGTIEYGYIKHDIEIKLDTEIEKPYQLNIKATTMWSLTASELIHDWQLTWEPVEVMDFGVNIGLGFKQISLTASKKLIGNLDLQLGVSYLYGEGFSPSIGLSLELF